MINFPPLRTRRLTVQLKELSIGDSIAIAAMPTHLNESTCTTFLRKALESSKGIADPANWTVQERMLAVCHYLAAVSEDGPDFSIGDGRYSDYLDGAADISIAMQSVPVGELGGDKWSVRHLTGAMAESIERMNGEVEGIGGRLHWLLGSMASQMVMEGEAIPDIADSDGIFDEFLVKKMRVLAGFPDSDFSTLISMYGYGRGKLHHLFDYEFDASGIVSLPKGGVDASLPPARFPVSACLSDLARELGRQSNELGG